MRTIPINDHSDGDRSKWPVPGGKHQSEDPEAYLIKLAALWMEQREDAQLGVNYRLDKLPEGYKLFKRPRVEDPLRYDKFLYGHPSKRKLNSPKNFFPHFLHLMQNHPRSRPCTCGVCIPSKDSRPSLISLACEHCKNHHNPYNKENRIKSRKGIGNRKMNHSPFKVAIAREPDNGVTYERRRMTQERRGRPKIQRVPETPKIPFYEAFIQKLSDHNQLDEPVIEKNVWEWRIIENIVVPEASKILALPSFYPRLGEIVLFDANNNEKEPARWEAGIVAQTTIETHRIEDPFLENPVLQRVQDYGFQIEPIRTYRKVNTRAKAAEEETNLDPAVARSGYYPLLKLRPFNYYREVASKSNGAYDDTIDKALVMAASFALIMKFHVRGDWPDLTVFSKGIWLGPELIFVGDVVNVKPTSKPTDPKEPKGVYFLEVCSIRLEIHNIDEDDTRSSEIFFLGRAFITPGSYLHPSDQLFHVPLSRVLGRRYSDLALSKWFPEALEAPDTTLASLGVKGILSSRRYSAEQDPRISRYPGRKWFWAESRAEQLNIYQFNGELVGDAARDAAKAAAEEDSDLDEDFLQQKFLRVIDRFEARISGKDKDKDVHDESDGATSDISSNPDGPLLNNGSNKKQNMEVDMSDVEFESEIQRQLQAEFVRASEIPDSDSDDDGHDGNALRNQSPMAIRTAPSSSAGPGPGPTGPFARSERRPSLMDVITIDDTDPES